MSYAILRKYAPLSPDSPGVGRTCILCRKEIRAGDETTLIPSGPASEKDREKMEQGRAYNAVAELVHWGCASLFDAIEI